MRTFFPVKIIIVFGSLVFMMLISTGCFDLGHEQDKREVYVDQQRDKPLIVGKYVKLEYVESEPGNWESDVWVMSPQSHINRIPAECTIYAYPEKEVGKQLLAFTMRIIPVRPIQGGYLRPMHGLGQVEWWEPSISVLTRGPKVRIGGSTEQPQIAATYNLSLSNISPYNGSLRKFLQYDLFVLSNPFSSSLQDTYFLIQIIR